MQILGIDQTLLKGFENSTLLVGLYDPADMLCYANAAYRDTFLRGLDLPVLFDDILRHGFKHDFGVKIDCGDVEQFLCDILPNRRQQSSRTLISDVVDGRWLMFTETLLDDDWLLTVATDISPIKQNEHRVIRLHRNAVRASQTDPLTGIANRRHILDLAAAALNTGTLNGSVVTLVLLDMDYFKQINDRHGHSIGDQVLIDFCNRCCKNLRSLDALGRLGGEEFMLVLPEATAEMATTLVKRIRSCVTQSHVIEYTFSAGIAQANPGETLEALMQRADAALYDAKHRGRDCYRISPLTQLADDGSQR